MLAGRKEKEHGKERNRMMNDRVEFNDATFFYESQTKRTWMGTSRHSIGSDSGNAGPPLVQTFGGGILTVLCGYSWRLSGIKTG